MPSTLRARLRDEPRPILSLATLRWGEKACLGPSRASAATAPSARCGVQLGVRTALRACVIDHTDCATQYHGLAPLMALAEAKRAPAGSRSNHPQRSGGAEAVEALDGPRHATSYPTTPLPATGWAGACFAGERAVSRASGAVWTAPKRGPATVRGDVVPRTLGIRPFRPNSTVRRACETSSRPTCRTRAGGPPPGLAQRGQPAPQAASRPHAPRHAPARKWNHPPPASP